MGPRYLLGTRKLFIVVCGECCRVVNIADSVALTRFRHRIRRLNTFPPFPEITYN